MPQLGTTQLCLPGPPQTKHPDVVGVAGHRAGARRRRPRASTAPTPGSKCGAEHAPPAAGPSGTGTSDTSRRVQPCAAMVAACSGPSTTKYSPWAIGALFCPSEAIADAHLSRIGPGVVALHVVEVVGRLTAVHGDRRRGVDADAGRIALPRGRGQVLGDAVRCTWPGRPGSRRPPGRAPPRRRGAGSAAPPDRWWRWPGCPARTCRCPRCSPRLGDGTVHDEQGGDRMGRGVDAAQVQLRVGPGRATAVTRTGRQAGRQPASTALTATRRRVASPNRGGRVAITSSGSTSPRTAQHRVDPRRRRRDEGQAVAPPVGFVQGEERLGESSATSSRSATAASVTNRSIVSSEISLIRFDRAGK